MHSNSEEVSTQAQAVFAATEEVNRNLENVANATGQMSTTIRGTAKNAPEAARIAGEARARAADTNTIIINLGDSVAKIEEVIKVVTSIAHEKNLLALTATIEAARAGEVGAGFAVVASEVKELARQTAASAEEISGTIEAIRGDAKETIDGIITQVHTVSTSIATAVEEQSASTDQMSSSLTGATKSSRDVAENIRTVPRRSRDTSQGTADLEKAATEISQTSTNLHDLVSQFRLAEEETVVSRQPRSTSPRWRPSRGTRGSPLLARRDKRMSFSGARQA